MTAATINDFIQRNRAFASAHKPHKFFSEGATPPKTLIITCVDPRCNPADFLGLAAGDALVLRNIAGHVPHNIKDILALDAFIGLEQIMVVQHTDCGATYFTDEVIDTKLKERNSADDFKGDTFGAVTDIHQSCKSDLAKLKRSPYIKPELVNSIRGFVYNLKTGLLEEVEAN